MILFKLSLSFMLHSLLLWLLPFCFCLCVVVAFLFLVVVFPNLLDSQALVITMARRVLLHPVTRVNLASEVNMANLYYIFMMVMAALIYWRLGEIRD